MHGVTMEVKINDLINIYEQEISKNVKNKRRVANFEINKMQNISDIKKMLEEGNIGHQKYNIFLIYEPKCRLVMSLSVKDKIINHYLKIDIRKYFYTIDHNILKNMLISKLAKEDYDLIAKVIDSTNRSYINKVILKYRQKYNLDIPLYANEKGLPIGNMTSQFLSIYYLNKLDHYIIHDLKCKYYVRYMDDFIIMHKDINYLKEVKKIISQKLKEEYLLNINEKKTFIVNATNGFSFLGYNYKIKNNKIIIKISRQKLENIKKRIKKVKHRLIKGKINYNRSFCSIMTYQYSYKYSKQKINNIIERYFYEK